MKLAVLFLLAASSVWGQTNTGLPKVAREGSNSDGKVLQAPTNQDFSPIQLGEQVRAACIQGRRSICGRILRVLPDGLIVESGYTNLLREPLSKSWLVPGTVAASRAANLVEGNEPDSLCVGQIFLTDIPRSRGDKPRQYDYVIIRGYPTGQYTYTSVGTIQRTVRRFSASLGKAVKLNYPAAETQSQARPAGVK